MLSCLSAPGWHSPALPEAVYQLPLSFWQIAVQENDPYPFALWCCGQVHLPSEAVRPVVAAISRHHGFWFMIGMQRLDHFDDFDLYVLPFLRLLFIIFLCALNMVFFKECSAKKMTAPLRCQTLDKILCFCLPANAPHTFRI